MATDCFAQPPPYGNDGSCIGGALIRGGGFGFLGGTSAGVFAINGANNPSISYYFLGFRCAREP
jgi:hypothetical protein